MPYLSFDLDALKMVPDAARSAGIAEAELGYGLVRLWSYCWTAKTDTVKAPHLAGFFGPSEALAPALMAFGFLADDGAGGYRVRGADKYLRITRAQSEAGKNNASNLRKGAEGGAGEDLRVGPPSQPGTQPGPTSGSAPALTPSTEHRTPNTEKEEEAPPPLQPDNRTPFVIQPPPADKDPEAWDGMDFWRWAMGRRQASGLHAEKCPHPAKLSGWWAVARASHSARVLKEAYYRFGDDEFWKKKAPPWPFLGFLSQWANFIPPKDDHAA